MPSRCCQSRGCAPASGAVAARRRDDRSRSLRRGRSPRPRFTRKSRVPAGHYGEGTIIPCGRNPESGMLWGTGPGRGRLCTRGGNFFYSWGPPPTHGVPRDWFSHLFPARPPGPPDPLRWEEQLSVRGLRLLCPLRGGYATTQPDVHVRCRRRGFGMRVFGVADVHVQWLGKQAADVAL